MDGMGSNGRWRTLAGDLDRVAYFYGLLVVEGFFCPFSEVGIIGELRCGHGWKVDDATMRLLGLSDLGDILNRLSSLEREQKLVLGHICNQ
jgi:hypothetical protein